MDDSIDPGLPDSPGAVHWRVMPERAAVKSRPRTSEVVEEIERAPADAMGSVIEVAARTIEAETVGPAQAARRAQSLRTPILVGLAGFGGLWALVATRRVAGFDLAVTQAIQGRSNPGVERAMAIVSWPGFPPQSRVIPAAIAGGWLVAGMPIEAACQAVGWGAAGFATLVKLVTHRPRPVAPQVQVVLAPLGGTSFPSGHVLSYAGTYGTLAYLLAARVRRPGPRAAAVAVPLALVGTVGVSRIHQGHHWLTDVLASYFLGVAYVAAIVALHRRLLERFPERGSRLA
jgi:membrane-associated phospholipid phosphatase